MKTKLPQFLSLAAILGSSLSFADDERKPEPPARRNRDADAPRVAEREAPRMRPAALLGVATSPLPPVLAAQLGLPEGFGLVVEEVMPDSPAGKAGVQRFDVLRLFNDQQLVDPGQLASLVRAQNRDAEVSLTLLRKGQEQKVSLKIAQRPMSERMPLSPPAGDRERPRERSKEGVGDDVRRLQGELPEFNQRLREYQERLRKWQVNPDGEMPRPPELRRPDGEGRRPEGEGQGRRFESRSTTADRTANAKVVMKDESGEIEVTETNGRRHLLAKNAKGETVFDGPIDTREQMRALPEELRRKVEGVKVQTRSESSDAQVPRRPDTDREER